MSWSSWGAAGGSSTQVYICHKKICNYMCLTTSDVYCLVHSKVAILFSNLSWMFFFLLFVCRVLESFPVRLLLQVIKCLLAFSSIIFSVHYKLTTKLVQFVLYLLCHPSWDIRRVAYDSTKKIIVAAPQLSEAIFLEFSCYLSAVGEKVFLLKR